MSATLRRVARRPITAWARLHAPAPVRPIVVIESDDWGRVGLPSLQSMEQLKAEGVPIGKSPWDFYGGESEDDVVRLGDILSEFRDADGRPACITANFVMANADLDRMQRENFQAFRWIPIDLGFPRSGRETLLPAYRANIDRGLFYPGLHGFTHLNASAMMKLLTETSARGDRMRQLANHGVPYLASLTPECNFALVERQGEDETFMSESDQESWIDAGVSLFARAFGRRPVTTCAPGYRANDTTFRIWHRRGIEAVQSNGWRGILASREMVFLERNVSFEPALTPDASVEDAIDAARRAVECGFPIVVCSHSINYMSRFLGYAEEGRRQLAEFLRRLLEAFPNLRFATDADLAAAFRTNDPAWFRRPTTREIAVRFRLLIYENASGAKLPPDAEDEVSPRYALFTPNSAVNAALNHEASPHAPIASRLGVPTIYMLLGNVFTLAVGLPLQIYVARVLGPGGVGVYGLLEAAMATAAGLLGLGVGMTVMRFVPEHLARHEYGEAVGLIRGSALVLVATGALAYAILLLLLPWIGSLWPAVGGYRWEIGTMGLMIPLSLLASFLQQGLRGFQNIRSIVIGSSVIQLAMKTVLTVGAFAAGLGLGGYILASVLATLCGVAWLSFSLVNHILALPSATPTLSPLRKWLRFALASYSGSLLSTATSGLDRFLLFAFIGSSAVGILVVLRQLQMLPERFNQMLLVIGAPLFSAAHGSDNRAERQHIYHLMTDWVVRSALPLALFLWLFGRDVLALYGPEFAAAGTLPLRILVGAQFFSLLCGPVGNLAMMSGLEWQVLRLNAINTVLLGAALAVLIPFFGLTGVALAYALAVVFMNVALIILVQQKLGVRWWDRRYLEWLLQCVAAFAVASIALYLLTPLNVAELAACLIAMYAAAVGATFLRGWHEDDKQLLGHVRQAVWGRLQP